MDIKQLIEQWKEEALQDKVSLYLILAWLVLVASGCATTSTHAKVISNLDGSVTQELKQIDITPPFAKKSEAIGKMHTRKGADGTYELETGTTATGMDNTGQTAVVTAVVQAAIQAYSMGLAVPKAPPKPTVLEQILPYVAPSVPKNPNGP